MPAYSYYASRFFRLFFSIKGQRLLLRELGRRRRAIPEWSEENTEKGLHAAIKWLLQAQKASPDDGFPTLDIVFGYSSSYPETSGYIAYTLYQYEKKFPARGALPAAESCVKWLLSIQRPSGGWQSGYVQDQRPEIVFNTAQVMRGLIAAYQYEAREEIAAALDRASDWLCEVQEKDGSWEKHNFLKVKRVYDTYVDAPLAEWALLRGNEKWTMAAQRNVQWVLSRQQENGWFADADNTIKHNERPILHTIAYTLDGLYDCSRFLNDPAAMLAVRKGAGALSELFLNKMPPSGRFDANWNGSEATILTGCAQMSILWGKLAAEFPHEKHWIAVKKKTDALLVHAQWHKAPFSSMNGAICGSFPLWGRYEPFRCPNWAVKYMADALLTYFPDHV